MKIRVPRTTEKATELLERFAALGAEVALIEATRAKQLAETNALADVLVLPLIEAMTAIKAKLQPWWVKAAAVLLKGARKSIKLGGCKIGSRAGRATLTVAGDEAAVLEALRALPWAEPYVRTTHSIDRGAVVAGLAGEHAAGLKALGFTMASGPKTFFVETIAAGVGETVEP